MAKAEMYSYKLESELRTSIVTAKMNYAVITDSSNADDVQVVFFVRIFS